MSNTTRDQVELTYQAACHLSVAMGEYRNARSLWDNFIDIEDRMTDLTLDQRAVRREAKTKLFNLVTHTMGKARRLHDEYMALESILNQLGGMKKCI